MKRNILIIALVALCLSAYSCGGGSAGTANVPAGENASLPSVLQLLPVQYVAQTGAYIYLKAKVLDGNGMVVPNVAVTFTNLSATGVLSPKAAPNAKGRPASGSGTVSATTDSLGVATITLYSTIQGFVTVEASVASTTSPAAPAAQITSKKTVYYSSYYLQCQDSTGIYIYGDGCQAVATTPVTTTPVPYIQLYVDGNNNAIYNESSDLTLFENTSDNQIQVLATVYDGAGGYVKNTTVTFAADSTEVTFPMGATATTDSNGQAYVLAKVTPSTTRSLSTVVNITASTSGGAAGLVSLYLSAVTISSLSVAATPTSILPDGKSTITASLKTSAGTPAPDGTSVTFAASCPPFTTVGYLATPFAQTTSGAATVTFTAPSVSNSCQVTASSAGLSATAYITVAAAAVATTTTTPDTLKIVPATVTVATSTVLQTLTSLFQITGGYAPYTTTGSDPGKAYNAAATSNAAFWSGTPLTVTIPANAASGAVTFTAYDSKGTSSIATMTILRAGTTATTLAINPATLSMKTLAVVTFYIVGGSGGPLQVVTSNTAFATVTGGAPVACTVGTGTLSCPAGTTSFTVNGVGAGAATITVIDSVTGASATSAVTVVL